MDDKNKIGEILYSWQAKEFSSNKQSVGWYVGAGIIFLVLIAYTIYARQWAGLGVVIAIGVLIYLTQKMLPRVFDHQIGSKGILVGEKFYSYLDIKSFWIVTDVNNPTLNLVSSKKLSLLLTLQLGTADVKKVKNIIGDFLPEDTDRGEDNVDKISRFLKL